VDPNPPPRAPARTVAHVFPGIGLIVLAGIQILMSLLGIVQCLSDPEGLRANTEQLMAQFGFPPSPVDPVTTGLITNSICLVFSIIQGIGGLAMSTSKMYVLAVISCIVAIANFEHCCCLLGAPVGVWGLIALFQPNVRAMFR
jgi:hypothetical protein